MGDTVLEARAKSLAAKKAAIEEEIDEQLLVLKSQGVGMSDPLVDSAGFPRADVDVFTVRHTRSTIIRLRNDARALEVDIALGSRTTLRDVPNSGFNSIICIGGNCQSVDGFARGTEEGIEPDTQSRYGICGCWLRGWRKPGGSTKSPGEPGNDHRCCSRESGRRWVAFGRRWMVYSANFWFCLSQRLN